MRVKVKRSFIVTVCRVLLGLTFVFSGFVKTIDPWGTALKVTEYLHVWGLGGLAGWLGDGGKIAIAIAMCSAELALGILLVAGVKKRLTSIVALVFMVVFTAMTLLSATVLPVEDCGCFGDALKVSPWVSLGKNVVLLLFTLAFWADVRVKGLKVKPFTVRDWIFVCLSTVASVGLGVWCFLHLPLIDFLPFERGVDLYQAKYVDEAEGDIALRQFAIFNSEGDGTHDLLGTSGRVYVLVASRLEDLTPKKRERFVLVAGRGDKVILVTSSGLPEGGAMDLGGVSVEVYNLDATTMISLLRARTGVVELYGGKIVDKRNWRDME